MDDTITAVKLLLSYEMKPEAQQEYYQFVMGQFIPTLQSMGLQMSEAWHTAYGDAPNRLIGFVCRDRQTMEELLTGETWESLSDQLEKFVADLDYKVLPFKDGFQL
ncbi:MAG: hypothetical protein ACE5FD_10900 [Anaerolineae bacterium]